MKRDKTWFKNVIEVMESETSENYPHEQMVDREVVLNLIDQLDEPAKQSKPAIPKIVAEQLEYWKRNKMNILWQFFLREIPSSTLSWLESDADNYDKLLDAEKNGYEIEKEVTE